VVNWDDLRYVLAVQRHGSLARAAKALGLNKSTVSRRIATLEHELGVTLLERGPLGYDLSKPGRRATAVAEQIETLVHELLSDVGGVDRVASGLVRVTAPHWFAQRLIIPGLPTLREAHPGLNVDLVTTDEVLNIAKGEADIAIRNQRPTQNSLSVRKGGLIYFGLYASREYLASHGTPRNQNDFEGHELIAYQTAVAHVKAYRWTNDLPCPIAFRASDAESMLDAVAAGLGIGVLPCFITTKTRGIVCLEEVGPPEPEEIWLVTQAEARSVERVQVVSKWLLAQFVEHAEWLAGGQGP
jgi:DNA-binding transcriptional LysR family regulator